MPSFIRSSSACFMAFLALSFNISFRSFVRCVPFTLGWTTEITWYLEKGKARAEYLMAWSSKPVPSVGINIFSNIRLTENCRAIYILLIYLFLLGFFRKMLSIQMNTKQATESKRWIISLKKPLGGRSLGKLSLSSVADILYSLKFIKFTIFCGFFRFTLKIKGKSAF